MTTRFAPVPPSPNCVSSRADPADRVHYIAPLPPVSMARLLETLASLPRVRIAEATDTYARAVFTSRLFRFADDVEFELERDRTHVRSASRVGWGDLGANRKRVEHLRELLAAWDADAAATG
jgi:uncharacterized protein (DUF1499 family)